MKCLKKLCIRVLQTPVCLMTVCILTVCLLAACGNSEETEDTNDPAETAAGVSSETAGTEDTETEVTAAEDVSDTSGTETWEDLYSEATKRWISGNYEDALDLLEQAIEMEPMAESLYLLRAQVYYYMAGEIDISVDTIDELQELYEKGAADTEKSIELINSGEAVEDDEEQLEEDLMIATSWNSTFLYEFTEAKSSLKNSYGATIFEYREEYQEFDEFSAEQQAWLETLLNACLNDSLKEVPLGELSTIFPNNGEYYTIWNSYKVWAYPYSFSSGNVLVEVEIRPENGLGYYVSIEYDAEEGKYSKQIVRTTCPCVDWLWNGEYNSTCTTVPSTYEIEEWGQEDWIVTTSGTMKDGMRTGTFTSSDNTYFTYDENGKMTDTSATQDDYDWYGTIRAERTSFSEETGLLMLYW